MQIGEKVNFGPYEWIVLDIKEKCALVITKDIVTQREYHNTKQDVTWEESEIRAFLNGEFYNEFSDKDKEKIILIENENPDNPWYKSKGGNTTKDKIFLLTIEDVVCKYFGDSSRLLHNPSAKQRYWFQRKDENNFRREAYYKNSGWWWWLRSPGRDNRRAVYIHGDGNIGIQGNGTYKYSSQDVHPATHKNMGGVRPALWIKLD